MKKIIVDFNFTELCGIIYLYYKFIYYLKYLFRSATKSLHKPHIKTEMFLCESGSLSQRRRTSHLQQGAVGHRPLLLHDHLQTFQIVLRSLASHLAQIYAESLLLKSSDLNLRQLHLSFQSQIHHCMQRSHYQHAASVSIEWHRDAS